MTGTEQNNAVNAIDKTVRPAITHIDVVVATDTRSATLFADKTATVYFTFNLRDIRGFGVEDIDLSQANCTLVPGSLRLSPEDGITWIAKLKANENVHSFGNVVRVNQAGFQDDENISGVGLSIPSLAYSIDTRRPKLITAENAITVDGNKVVLRFDQNLDEAKQPTKARFKVIGEFGQHVVTGVLVTGGDITLTLATPVKSGQQITVRYEDPAPYDNDSVGVIQNAAGNDAAAPVSQIALNITPPQDTTPPAFHSATLNGRELVLHYTDANSLGATGPERAAFTVHITNDTIIGAAGVTNVAVNAAAKTVTLTLAIAAKPGQVVYLSYRDPTTGDDARAIQDAAGNDAGPIERLRVTNNTQESEPSDAPDTTAPEINRATINGNQLVLSYTEAGHLYAEGELNRQGFIVTINGARSQVVNAAVNATANTITLTLDKAAAPGDDVLMSYSAPAMPPQYPPANTCGTHPTTMQAPPTT